MVSMHSPWNLSSRSGSLGLVDAGFWGIIKGPSNPGCHGN